MYTITLQPSFDPANIDEGAARVLLSIYIYFRRDFFFYKIEVGKFFYVVYFERFFLNKLKWIIRIWLFCDVKF